MQLYAFTFVVIEGVKTITIRRNMLPEYFINGTILRKKNVEIRVKRVLIFYTALPDTFFIL